MLHLFFSGLLIPCLYFDEALSIKEAIRRGDVKAAVEILQEVLRNSPYSIASDENFVIFWYFYTKTQAVKITTRKTHKNS